MLISSQSSCLESTMETIQNNVPKIGKNVARKSTSNRPLKNIPNAKSTRTEDNTFNSEKIVKLTPSQNNHYANLESTRYSTPQTYHFSNSARYSDHLHNKPGLIQDSFVGDSEEECDNIDGVFSISGSMMKYLKESQMSPSLSDDSDDAVDPRRVLYFPVKYEFPNFAVQQLVPPCFSDDFASEGSDVLESDQVDVQPNSSSNKKKVPTSPIKGKLSIKKELFRDSNTTCTDLSTTNNNIQEADNENMSGQNVNTTDSNMNEGLFNLKIEFITSLSHEGLETDDLTWASMTENVSLEEANVAGKSLESHVAERTIKTDVGDEMVEMNVGKEKPEVNVKDKIMETNIGDNTIEDKIIETNIKDKIIEKSIGENINETTVDKPVENTAEKPAESMGGKPVLNVESNNFDEMSTDTVTNVNKVKTIINNKTKKETAPTKIGTKLSKGKVTKQKKKSPVLPKRTTRSSKINLVDKTIECSLVKRVLVDRKTQKPKGATSPPVTKRGRPFSNRRSKANLNLAEDSSENSDSSLTSSVETENKAVSEKTKSKDTEKPKSAIALEKSEGREDPKSDAISNSEKPKDSKKFVKIKPEINEGILLHVEAAKKTNIMRDGKILKDKKDLLKDVDSTIDKNLPLEVDKQGFEIQQSLTEEILLDQALRLAHQRTSPRRRPLLTTSQAKEIVNSLTSQTRARRKSTEKKTNSSGSPGKQKRGSDTNSTEADLSNTAETESDSEMKQDSSINEMKQDSSINEMKQDSSINEMKQDSSINEMKQDSSINEMKQDSSINEMKQDYGIDETSPSIKSETSRNLKKQEKKTSKPKKINIKSILKKMADTLDPNMDINSLSKTFENVIKNFSELTNTSNSEASDSDSPEEKKVITRTKKKTKTRKKAKSNFTQEDSSFQESKLPVNNREDLIPVIVIKNKSKAFLRERSQRIPNSNSNKEDSNATVILESATTLQDLPASKSENKANDSKDETNISCETTSIPRVNGENSDESSAVITSADPYTQKVTTSEEAQYEKKKLILDESCRSLVIDESLNESSLNLECKSVTDSTPLPEFSNDEVTSTTEIDKTEDINNEEGPIIIEDSPASPDEIYEPPPESKKSEAIEIIEIDDVEVDSSTKIVEPIPFLDNCDTTVSETGNDLSKDNFSQLSISTSSDSIKETIYTPESIDTSPTKLGKLSGAQKNPVYTSDSSSDTLLDVHQETATDQTVVADTTLLGNSGIVQNTPTHSSTASLIQATSAVSTNPAVYTNVTSGLNISPAMKLFSPPNSNGVFSLSSDATQITTSIVTSTLLQHISQKSLASSINPLDPAFNPNAHFANYFNQTQQNYQYPLTTNSLQYSSTSSSEVTQLAQTSATSSSTIPEELKPKPKSIDVPLSILARDPRLRKKSVRIIVDNVEFTTPVSGNNPMAPSASSDPRDLVTPRVPSASMASATPRVQAVAPFSKQQDNVEIEPDEPGSTIPENIDNSEEGNEVSPVHEIPKKKSKKKEIDKELLYKTPLCDLHEETSERSSYSRKPKRTAPSRFEAHRQSETERPSYTHHDPYREKPDLSYHQNSDIGNYHGINAEHYNEESHEYPKAAFRRAGEKVEGYRRKEEFPQHSRRPDHFSRRDYEDPKRRDPSDRRPLLEHAFGRFNHRYKDYSPDQSTDYKYRRNSNNYPRYDYAHKKVDGEFPGDDEDGQSSSRPYYRRRHFHGSGGFSSNHHRDEEELFKRRWEGDDEDWRHRRSFRERSPPFSRSNRVERPHGPGRGLELESPLSPD